MKNTLIQWITVFVLFPVLTFAQVHTIQQQNFTFSPSMLSVQVGDTIRWEWTSGAHTTTSGGIPSGAAPWDSPLSFNQPFFEYVITVPGSYSYFCTPHQSMGMTGIVEAFSTTSTGIDASTQAFNCCLSPDGSNLLLYNIPPVDAIATLYDLNGRKLSEHNIKAFGQQIPLDACGKGLHIVVIATVKGEKFSKLFYVGQ